MCSSERNSYKFSLISCNGRENWHQIMTSSEGYLKSVGGNIFACRSSSNCKCSSQKNKFTPHRAVVQDMQLKIVGLFI